MQCLAKDNQISVIEVNLRASRTFPFISKVTGVNLIEITTDAFFGKCGKETPIQINEADYVAVKAAQFSFGRLTGADPVLDVEMASTGEVGCFGDDVDEAFLKAELSVGSKIPEKSVFLTLGGEESKIKFLESARLLHKNAITIYATYNTSNFLKRFKIPSVLIHKIYEDKSPNVIELFQERQVEIAVSIADPTAPKDIHDDYLIRRSAVDNNIPLYTDLKKAELFVHAIANKKLSDLLIKSWDEYVK